ncbi:MAG: cache domain-containing protein [Reyranella sp.]|nr:cache domain-containing protein [Reyranella sp.]
MDGSRRSNGRFGPDVEHRAATAGRRADRRRTLVVAGLQILLIWTAAAVLIWYSHRDAVEDGKRMAENTSLTIAAYMKQSLGAADLVLKSIQDWISEENTTAEPQFRQIMQERRFFDEMRERVVGLPQIVVVGIIARDGELLNTTHAYPAAPLDLSERETYRASMAAGAPALVLTGSSPGRASGRSTFYLVRKVVSKSGETLGLVTIGLDVDFLADFFRRISVGEDSSLSLFRDDGTLLATSAPRPDALGKRFEDALPVGLIAEGGSGRAVYTDRPGWLGPETAGARIVVPRSVEGYPVFVSLVIGDGVFLTRWREMSLLVMALALALAVVTFLATHRILRLIDRSAAASRAESERGLLAAVVDTPSALTAVLDRAGEVVHANTRFREVFGSDAEIRKALHGPELRGADKVRDFVAGEAKLAEVDLEIARPGNQTQMLHFSLSRRALPDSGDCTVMVGHDETVRHQARQAIALSSKMVTLGEITTGIAHELSQPLNVIRMAAQNALTEIEPEPPEEGDEDLPRPEPLPEPEFRAFVAAKLHRVVAQVDRAAEILSRMRLFSRETRQGPQAFDVRDACRSALALAEPRLRRSGIAAREDLGGEALMVVGHPTRFEQGVVSLLMNAVDALAESSQDGKLVELTAGRGPDGCVRVRIRDNGPGVPAAIRDRIFEPFFTTKPVGQGTGLGLATTFGLVRDCGGALTLLDDAPGGPEGPGATFQIDLPAAAVGRNAVSA